jgi:autotransporter-associated beta strand protein
VNQAADATYSGIISGTGGLAKNGSSILTLSGTNTYSGLTTINDGILKITNAAALGNASTGTLVNTGGALEVSNVTVELESLTINGTGYSLSGALLGSGNSFWKGPINIATDSTIGVTTNSVLTIYQNMLSGAGSFTKVGNGILNIIGEQQFPANLDHNNTITETNHAEVTLSNTFGFNVIIGSYLNYPDETTIQPNINTSNSNHFTSNNLSSVMNDAANTELKQQTNSYNDFYSAGFITTNNNVSSIEMNQTAISHTALISGFILSLISSSHSTSGGQSQPLIAESQIGFRLGKIRNYYPKRLKKSIELN